MEENNSSTPSSGPSNMQKKYIYIAIAGVVVLLVLFLVLRNNNGNFDSTAEEFIPELPAEQIIPPTSTVSSTKTTTPVPPKRMADSPLSATQKYLDAIKVYKNTGYYFQFVECQGSPGTLTMKKGKKFMLDNRDNKTRRIAIEGGQSFKIGAYNFAIATAPSKTGTYYITCDGGGAATILVQQ